MTETFIPLQIRRLLMISALAILSLCAAPTHLFAHQQPTTIALLDVRPNEVAMELQMPLSELELAFGHDITQNPGTLIERLSPQLTDYLLAHIHPTTRDGQPWSVKIARMKIEEAEQTQSGAYQEITIRTILTPPPGSGTRNFILNYDAVMHQVVSHKALVGIRSDWETGKIGAQPVTVGLIKVDTETTKIFPLEINLSEGDSWRGFRGMVSLGMEHIKTGTDHLLFLLVLLLPAPLLTRNRRWAEFGGTRYGLKRLLKIATAFTVGHSATLVVGAFGLMAIPSPPVEILIAVSILVSAIHAVRPIFPGKEIYVAAGFGLIHGLAFAAVLFDLNLGAGQMALSILGFNVGIELMQIFVIALVVPWLMMLALTPVYRWVRNIGAAGAAVASLAWIVERISGTPNVLSGAAQKAAENAHLGILVLAFVALAVFGWQFVKNKNQTIEA